MYAIVADGANDLSMITVVCETEEECHAILQDAGGVRKKRVNLAGQIGGTYVDGPKGDYITTEGSTAYKAEDGFINLDDEDVCTYLLTYYDGGCGGIYGFSVQEIGFGKPLCGWDLD